MESKNDIDEKTITIYFDDDTTQEGTSSLIRETDLPYSANITDERTKSYLSARSELWSNKLVPFVVHHMRDDRRQKKWSYVFMRKPTEPVINEINKIARDMVWYAGISNRKNHPACFTCKQFLLGPAFYVDANGKSPLDVCTCDAYASVAKNIRSCHIQTDTVKFITNHDIGDKMSGSNTRGEPFYHLSIKSDSVTENVENIVSYQISVDHWLPIFKKVFNELASPETIKSMDVCIELLKKITYGDKLLRSAEWFRDTMEKYLNVNVTTDDVFARDECLHETGTFGSMCYEKRDSMIKLRRIHVLIEAMLPELVEGVHELMGCPVMSQFNKNTRNAMETAHNEKAFRTLIKNRLDPTVYCRPTSEPSALQLIDASKIIGDFENNLMTTSDLIRLSIEYPDFVRIICNTTEARGTTQKASDILIEAAKNKKQNTLKNNSGITGFASRCQTRTKPSTFTQLLTMPLSSLKGLQIWIDNNMYCTYLTTYPDSCKHLFTTGADRGYLWTYFLSTYKYLSHDKRFGMQIGWSDVTCIVDCKKSIFFGVKDATITERTGATHSCYPETICPKYKRIIRKSMELLCNKRISVPTGQTFVAGIGTTMSNTDKKTINKIVFRFAENPSDTFFIQSF